jgi:phosphate transport system substrate-binding protein
MKNKNYLNGIMSMPATGAIIQSVGQTRGAIGYVGLAYLTGKVKALAVSYDKGATAVEPSVSNAKNGTYPIVRPLLYYYISSYEEKVKPFLDYVLSPDGQKIATDSGFIPR